MKQRIVAVVIIAVSLGYFAWTLANPPTGSEPGATNGAITASSTSATTADVTINGTTTIQKSLDVSGNRILNVATPTLNTDAANKAYVDAALASVTSSTTRVWGQGRPGAAVTAVAGVCGGTAECYRDLNSSGACNTGDIKIARSTKLATWPHVGAVCPSGWWVCTAEERGSASCGSGNRTVVECKMSDDLPTNDYETSAQLLSWVTDAGVTNHLSFGALKTVAGVLGEQRSCEIMTVWCCKNQ